MPSDLDLPGLCSNDEQKQKLNELTSSINFSEPYDVKGHQAIYDYIDNPQSPDASSGTVPPSLIFYAACNILSPTFILGQIPDLLDLLAAVETFRQFAAIKSEEALQWQRYYEREQGHGHEENVRLLAANEVRALQRFLVQKDPQRREYVVLVRCLILLYIHYLWTAPESCLLAKRLNDFFPGSLQDVEKPSELLFHVGLSEDEQEYFGRLKLECQEWMNLVLDWENKRKANGQSQEEMEGTFAEDFYHAFPQPSKPSEMAQNVKIYINKVESIVRKLEEWFPAS